MKVTVCFGSTRVIVPCGDGELPVRDLIEKAIVRYKKATGKPSDYWVTVHNVKTSEEGGILDPDDQLNDVADDREQIIAYFEEQGGPPVPHNGGDGASASSVGTSSPDIFQGGEITVIHSDRNDVVVTPGDLSSGSALKVRRGSEPALNSLGQDEKITDYSNTGTFPKKAKRWSAIITPIDDIHVTSTPKRDSDSSEDEGSRKLHLRVGGNGQDKNLFNRFARDSWRQSLSNQPSMFKWLEAQERQEDQLNQGRPERKDPVGGSATVTGKGGQKEEEGAASESSYSSIEEDNSVYLTLHNNGGPLGIHVVPDFDENGRDMGLKVQSIEKGGRIFKDGRLKVDDRIIEINGTSLVDVNFTRAQSVFKQAMQTDDIRLRVLKFQAPALPKQPPPVLPKFKPNRNHSAPSRPSPLTLPNVNSQSETTSLQSTDSYSDTDSTQKTSSSVETVSEKTPTNSNSGTDSALSNCSSSRTKGTTLSNGPVKENSGKSAVSVSFNVNGKVSQPTKSSMPIKPGPPIKAGGGVTVNGTSNVITNGNRTQESSSRKVPPQPPARHPSTSLSASSSNSSERGIAAPTNTRRIGKKINIQLTKGPVGLGFSITTRDNPAGGNCPIYIKNILPKGAAIMDGRLKAGDRLLEVNGIEMTGKDQSEAVNILRTTKMGSIVQLVISRQVNNTEDMFRVPRKLVPEVSQEPVVQTGKSQAPITPAEKAADEDGTLALRKNKEILELNIPLNDTGSAGLGVSVKGKTQTTDTGVQDLGIFIKAVIHGGAASKDGRLVINDQLLDVNAESLVGLSNAEAMEMLRKAMQEEGQTPGCINIKIARRIGTPSPSPFGEEERELKIRTVSEASESSNMSRLEMEGGDHVCESSDMNDPQDKTVCHSTSVLDHLSGVNQTMHNTNKLHNPLLDRLRNNDNNGNRNESYNRAVHDSMNDSKLSSLDGSTHVEPVHPPHAQRPHPPHVQPRRPNKLASPTVNFIPGEMVMIEQDDPYATVQKFTQSSKLRPHSTIGIMRTNSYSSSSQSNEEGGDYRDSRPPEFIRDWDRHRTEAKEDDFSPVVDPMKAFQREGFGRQSMSEKRKVKAHLDPRGSEYYQRAKQAQENNRVAYEYHSYSAYHQEYECRRSASFNVSGSALPTVGPLTRAGSAESLLGRTNTSVHDYTSHHPAVVGPTLGMKKSSSLESLERAIQDVAMESGDDTGWSRGRYQRNRGCNESFRAAVDRSYDPTKLQIQMDILEEDGSESGANIPGRPASSTRSSFSSETADQDSLKRKKKDKEKKGGIFKGIFKFGRNRKTVENLRTSPFEGNRQSQSEWEKPHAVAGERIHPVRPPQPNQERLQEHYRRVQENQRQQEWEKTERERERYEYEQQQHHDQENYLDDSLMDLPPGTRAEKIQQLRQKHQRKHRERQGQYPLEEQEEQYEQELQLQERRRYGESKAPQNALDLPPRQRSESRQDYESRPSSRLGFSDNISYSHYQNQEEVQENMRRDDYYRDQYLRHQRPAQPHSHVRQLQPIGPSLSGRTADLYHNRQAGETGGTRWQTSYSASNVRPYTPIPQMYTTSQQRATYEENTIHQRSSSYDEYDDPSNAYRDHQSNYGYSANNRRLNPSSAKV